MVWYAMSQRKVWGLNPTQLPSIRRVMRLPVRRVCGSVRHGSVSRVNPSVAEAPAPHGHLLETSSSPWPAGAALAEVGGQHTMAIENWRHEGPHV